KGYEDIQVIAGVLANRERTALLLDSTSENLPYLLLDALKHPVEAQHLSGKKVPCQEVIHRAPLDIRKIIPAPTNTLLDAGPYFSMGLLRAEDPETGESDVTIHRLCVQGPDLLTVWFTPGRHIDAFRIKAEEKGQPLPVSVNMGLDPAIYLTACFEPPTTPLGFDELSLAGAIRNRPVELVDCVSVNAKAIANAEIVLEGELLPGDRMREDIHTDTGYSMPEFTGYMGAANPSLPVLKIKAVTHRKKPILQTIVGPGEEHGNLSGIPMEASILRLADNSMPGRVRNVYAHPAGGGKFLAVIQFRKTGPTDEGRQRQAALTAFTAFPELKHVILVDEDVNLYDSSDILWAMTTRYQGDLSTVFIPGVLCHPLDPTQTREFNPSLRGDSISCKTIFDCTVPYDMKDRFRRSPFMAVDEARFFKSGTKK
ncbi:MAG: UbiD family decarboxylase, partial [Deltaproteobacteria bacterium]|nr:UbiD family decarboxylase [Deltaproteobacteria bacterium]